MQRLGGRLLLLDKAAAALHSQRLISAGSQSRLAVGYKLTCERVFSQEEVLQFVQVTGDANPIHAPAAAAHATAQSTEGQAAAAEVQTTGPGGLTATSEQHASPHRPAPSRPAAAGRHAIVPGMLMAAMFPALIGSAFPGALYLSQDLSFRRSAHVGDHVRAEVAVTRCSGSRVVFDTKCVQLPTQHVLVDGKALALIKHSALAQ